MLFHHCGMYVSHTQPVALVFPKTCCVMSAAEQLCPYGLKASGTFSHAELRMLGAAKILERGT